MIEVVALSPLSFKNCLCCRSSFARTELKSWNGKHEKQFGLRPELFYLSAGNFCDRRIGHSVMRCGCRVHRMHFYVLATTSIFESIFRLVSCVLLL